MAQAEGGDVRVVEVGALDGEAFARVYRTVLEPSFPASELLTLEEFSSSGTGGPESPGLVAFQDGEPIAAALGDADPDTGVVLLSYLASRPDRRSRGVGGHLLGRALATWQKQLSPSCILAEVEDPAAHGPSAYGDPAARLRFYDRMGARRLDLAYTQPALRPGAPRVPGMLLVALAAGGPPAAGPPAAAVRRYLWRYVAGCEGVEDPEADDEFGPILARLRALGEGRVPIEVLAVDASR